MSDLQLAYLLITLVIGAWAFLVFIISDLRRLELGLAALVAIFFMIFWPLLLALGIPVVLFRLMRLVIRMFLKPRTPKPAVK